MKEQNLAYIGLSVSKELKEQIQQDAREHGLSISCFLRQLYLMYKAAEKEKNESA